MEFCQEQHLCLHGICLLLILTVIYSTRTHGNSSKRPNFLIIYRRYETPLGETVVDLINARGVYLILGVQKGAFKRQEAFKRERAVYSQKCNNKFEKIIYFRQKYQESFRIPEYPLHQLIRLGRVQRHISLFQFRILAQGYCVAIVISLSLLST